MLLKEREIHSILAAIKLARRYTEHYLDGNTSSNEDTFEEKCKHASNMEYLATKAERDSIKYMQVKYMQDHKDETFLG